MKEDLQQVVPSVDRFDLTVGFPCGNTHGQRG